MDEQLQCIVVELINDEVNISYNRKVFSIIRQLSKIRRYAKIKDHNLIIKYKIPYDPNTINIIDICNNISERNFVKTPQLRNIIRFIGLY
jgi:hypothetical protein